MKNINVTGVSFSDEDEKWMRLAIEQARAAFALGEIPVGAVVVCKGELIALAHNTCEETLLCTRHAEIIALEAAEQRIGRRFMSDCTLYVTMEPCPMCAGACVNAHLGRIVFAASDPVSGACGSVLNITAYPLLYRPQMQGGLLNEEARLLLQTFFVNKRKDGLRKNGKGSSEQ